MTHRDLPVAVQKLEKCYVMEEQSLLVNIAFIQRHTTGKSSPSIFSLFSLLLSLTSLLLLLSSTMTCPAIGIDLGTTYSCVAVWSETENRAEVIANDLGYRTTPSCVAFTPEERLVGNSAVNQMTSNARNTVFGIKRLIGRLYNDSVVRDDSENWPFHVVPGDEGKPVIEVMYQGKVKHYTPEEISSMILMKMKEIAQNFLGRKVTDAVITVPAYFNDAQRQATKDAGIIANLNVLRILNEPTAAAVAYGAYGFAKNGAKMILVYDLGGGTFDVSLLRLHEGEYQVQAIGGDTHLGGEDFDVRLMNHLRHEFLQKHKRAFPNDPRSLRRLRTCAERAKRELSVAFQTFVEIDSVGGVDFQTKITRAKFEGLVQDLVDHSLRTVEQVLKDAGVSPKDVDEVLLVGGSTRVPKIQLSIQQYFLGKKPCQAINAEEAVAYGAAVFAYRFNCHKNHSTSDLSSHHSSIHDSVNHHQNFILRDVTPLSLGLEDCTGGMCVVIPRNTSYPIIKKREWMTSFNGQTTVSFPIYEGESKETRKNHLLGKFEIKGIPPGPAGSERLVVTFEIDRDGILKVSAQSVSTGKAAGIVLTGHGKLGSKAVERMMKEATKFQEESARKLRSQSSGSYWAKRFSFIRPNTGGIAR